MKSLCLIGVVALSLSACGPVGSFLDTLDAEQQARDLEQCQREGFVVGTTPMAQCIGGIEERRELEIDREVAAETARRER